MSTVEHTKQPLGVGSLVAQSFGMMFRKLHVFIGVLMIPILIMVSVFAGVAYLQGGAATPNGFGVSTDGLPVALTAVVLIVSTIAVFLIFGMVILAAYDIRAGRRVRPFGYIGTVIRAILPIILNFVVIIIPVVALIAALAGIGAALDGTPLVGPILGIVGIAAYAYFIVKLSILIPTVLIERTWLSGLSRAFYLTKGYFWPILGAYLIIIITVVIIVLGLGIVMSLYFAGMAAIAEPGNTPNFVIMFAVVALFYVVVMVIGYILPSIFSALLYARLREVKEGLGMEDLATVFE